MLKLNAECHHNVKVDLNSSSTIEQIREVITQLNLPILEFTLKDNKFPTYDIIHSPSGCIGTSITNNDYVEGSLRITLKGETLYDSGDYEAKKSGVRLKCRGNTSTAAEYNPKKGYKIKLSKKADLLCRESDGAKDKDWVLKGTSRDLKQFTGDFIAKECGSVWQPASTHVCVIINDVYMGSYVLCEAVNASKDRVDISDSGFIIENDAYWWKPDEYYFKTPYSLEYLGWTIKEPDIEDVGEEFIENVSSFITQFESDLHTGNNVLDKIDVNSFTSWILTHDILNTIDACGSNVYVTKYDLNQDDPFSSKIAMGPTWDYDDTLQDVGNSHCIIYTHNMFWYSILIKDSNFFDAVYQKYMNIHDDLEDKLRSALEEYATKVNDLHKIRSIDSKLGLVSWGGYSCPDDDVEKALNFVHNRLNVLNDIYSTGFSNIPIKVIDTPSINNFDIYDIYGRKLTNCTTPGIKIIIKDGTAQKILK